MMTTWSMSSTSHPTLHKSWQHRRGVTVRLNHSSSHEPEEEPVSTAPREATPVLREVVDVIDVAESLSHMEPLFDEAQTVTEKLTEASSRR